MRRRSREIHLLQQELEPRIAAHVLEFRVGSEWLERDVMRFDRNFQATETAVEVRESLVC